MIRKQDHSTDFSAKVKSIPFTPPVNWNLLQPLLTVRKTAKVSQVKLAEVMGVFQSDVSTKERGRGYIGKSFLERYEKALFSILKSRSEKDLQDGKRILAELREIEGGDQDGQ